MELAINIDYSRDDPGATPYLCRRGNRIRNLLQMRMSPFGTSRQVMALHQFGSNWR